MDILLRDVLISLAGGGITAYLVLQFLGKSFVRHQLEKSLHTFDAALARRTESLKTELSMYAHEQNVAVSRLDSQRAKAIQDVYSALRAWTEPASIVAAGSPLRNEDNEIEIDFYLTRAEEAHTAGKALADALANNAIYFEIELYERLAALVAKSIHMVAAFLQPLRRVEAEGCPLPQLLHFVEADQAKFAKEYADVLHPAIQDVTDRFRKALGVIRGNVELPKK